MLSWKLLALFYLASSVFLCHADEEQESATNMKAQRAAVKAWADSLEEKDYDADYWAKTHHNFPANFFEYYATRLSDIFKEKGAKVNFALVGACDGTNDRTIRDRYLPNEHWRGVFVEPFTMNYKDLSTFMEKHGVSHRSHLIHAAATRKCNSTTIKMKRPTFEEKNASLPHWMRRQIGAVVPFNKLNNKMTGGWVAEFTRCVSGPEILQDWTDALNHQSFPSESAIAGRKSRKESDEKEENKEDGEEADGKHGSSEEHKRKKGKGRKKGGGVRMLRPHVLKVDVEGHDYEVLMGFLGEEMTQSMLPLMINFEAKSITAQFPALKETMEKRGYAVSHFATDGFALLRADAINRKPRNRPATTSSKITTEKEPEPEPEQERSEGQEEVPQLAMGLNEFIKKARDKKLHRNVDDAVVPEEEKPETAADGEGGEAAAEGEGRGKRGGRKGKGGKGKRGKRKGKGKRGQAEAGEGGDGVE